VGGWVGVEAEASQRPHTLGRRCGPSASRWPETASAPLVPRPTPLLPCPPARRWTRAMPRPAVRVTRCAMRLTARSPRRHRRRQRRKQRRKQRCKQRRKQRRRQSRKQRRPAAANRHRLAQPHPVHRRDSRHEVEMLALPACQQPAPRAACRAMKRRERRLRPKVAPPPPTHPPTHPAPEPNPRPHPSPTQARRPRRPCVVACAVLRLRGAGPPITPPLPPESPKPTTEYVTYIKAQRSASNPPSAGKRRNGAGLSPEAHARRAEAAAGITEAEEQLARLSRSSIEELLIGQLRAGLLSPHRIEAELGEANLRLPQNI
jgi:hypothetical protein